MGDAVAQAFAAAHPYHVRVFTTEEAAVAWLVGPLPEQRPGGPN
ncbi:hypothetical protein [Hymenobacter convexus]|nr:hypothetical protein [Hymenobacter sp. CA1UV-4]MDO7851746.1 hypothetical protein [Hymenobacter sp. CA1UV-4]